MQNAKISLAFQNFLVFRQAAWVSSSPITLILGPNRTGKTHILLTLFAFFKHLWLQVQLEEESPSLRSLFLDTFLVRKVDALRRWRTRGEPFRAKFSWEGVVTDLQFPEPSSTARPKLLSKDHTLPIPFYYSPAGLGDYYKSLSFVSKSFRNWRVISYAVIDLISTVLLGEGSEADPDFIKAFHRLFGEDLKFSVERERIYVYEKGIPLKAERAASGLKNLSWLYLLGKAGMLRNAILLADEPEAHLHPEYVLRFTGLLSHLVKGGTRVFLVTHSDLLVAALNRWIEITGHTVSVWEVRREEDGTVVPACYEASRERLIDDRALTGVYLETVRLSEEVERILSPVESDAQNSLR